MPRPLTFGLSRIYIANFQQPSGLVDQFQNAYDQLAERYPTDDHFVSMAWPLLKLNQQTGAQELLGMVGGISSDIPAVISTLHELDQVILNGQKSGDKNVGLASVDEPIGKALNRKSRFRLLKMKLAEWAGQLGIGAEDPEMSGVPPQADRQKLH